MVQSHIRYTLYQPNKITKWVNNGIMKKTTTLKE